MTNYSAFGTLLKQGDGGGPESFTTIAQVRSIGGPGLGLNPIDVTNHSSANGWAEFVGGILDGGEVTLDVNYDPADATHDVSTGLVKDMTDRTVRNFQLVFPDSATTTWTIPALVTAFEPGAPFDDRLSAAVTLKVSGQPTLA